MGDTRRSGPAQYENATRFNARVALHARFRTNPRPWPVWVFDQLEGHDGCRVLDLGCGTGLLWQVNAPRVPASWTLVLTDSSEGMLAETRRRLDALPCRVEYRAMDAQEVTFPDGAFDIVVANHMLYHVPRRERAIAEARRVLREGGAFHATTASVDSLVELRALHARVQERLERRSRRGSATRLRASAPNRSSRPSRSRTARRSCASASRALTRASTRTS